MSPKSPGLHDWSLTSAALEEAYDAVVITTADLAPPGPVIVYVNRAFAELTGYSANEVLGNNPRLLQGRDTDRTVLDALRESLSAGRRWEGRAINYRKDGTAFLLEWRIAPVRDAFGRITHWVSFQREIVSPGSRDTK
jgi:PAS domain S-box-containing protein